MNPLTCTILSAILLLYGLMAGCADSPRDTYELKGRVVAVNPDNEEVTLEHEEIPGYMTAMTMPFKVKDKWVLSVMAPGQTVEATLVVQDGRSWIEDIMVSGTGSVGRAAEASVIPEPGDQVPDFTLTNQDGKEIHLSQYKGRPLVLTFIYTRCPLPDYCPLTSSKFAAIYRASRSLPQSGTVPHLLTVSFDAQYDTPEVLREYAQRYMNPVRFDRWEFATGTEDQVRKITGYFGLVYERESNQIVHSLVTALIGPDGRLVRLYLGNEWRPEEVMDALSRGAE
jgi:protein SCO1/2